MGVYSKTLRHVDSKDFRRTRQRRLDEQKVLRKVEEDKIVQEKKEVEEIKSLSLPYQSNWRLELFEGMTTGGGQIQFAPTDVPLDTIDAADPDSFTAAVGGFDTQGPEDGLSGAQIVSNGTGSGNNGGFNLGRSYLSFNGVGFDSVGPGFEGFDNARHVMLTPIDASRATTLEITAIVGNGSNGGEAPSVNQDLQLWYTDASEPNIITAALDGNGDFITVVPYNGSGSLRTYSVTIPNNEINNLRRQGIQFILYQDQGNNPTTTGDNYGITEIKVKRTTPISVFAPLDTPEAVSFFRVGPSVIGANYETPEQRYRRVMQQLLASKSYTDKIFGSNYPGSNFSGIRGVSSSPVDKQGMYDAWSKASERNAELAASTFMGSQQSKATVAKKTEKGPLATVKNAARNVSTKNIIGGVAAAAGVGGIGLGLRSSLGSANTRLASPTPKTTAPNIGSYKYGVTARDLKGNILKPGVQSPLPPTSNTNPTTRVKDFGARMDALRNPKGGSILQQVADKNPQQGPQRISKNTNISSKPPSTVSKAPTSSAKPAAKPSFTPQQQKNIKSVQSQLRNVASNVGVKLSPAGIAAAVFKPTAAGNPAADRNPQQYTKQVQQQYAQKAASSGQFGKYAPPSTQVKTSTSTYKAPAPAPTQTFQNTGGYGKYAPPSTQVKTSTSTSSGGYSKASGYLRPVSTPAPTQTFQNTGGYGKYAPPSTQVKTPAPAPKPAAPKPAPKPTTTAKKK